MILLHSNCKLKRNKASNSPLNLLHKVASVTKTVSQKERSTSIPAFVIIKLTVTVCVGLIFVLVDITILESADKDYKSFKTANKILKIAYIGIILFLVIVVANNIFVLIKVLW
jgi:hypothetical protein